MAKRTIQAYNATISAIKKATGVSQREAQQVYRTASVRLGRPPTASEAKRSTAIRQEAKRAGAQLRAKERARDKRIEKAIQKARKPGKGKKTIEIPPPKRPPGGADRRGGAGGHGGGAGGRGGAPGGRGGGRIEEPGEEIDIEPPDEIHGEEDESPDGE